MLLLGWWSALRRSNLAALRWSDITSVPGGIELHIRRSKTDQEGRGAVVFVPSCTTADLPCPVHALASYAERLAAETGVNPVGLDAPVFAAVDRHDRFQTRAGAPWTGMSGAAVNELVRRVLAASGGDPTRFGSHSLRAGFITSAFDLGIPASDIARTSLHASIDVLMRYNRPTDRRRRSAGAQINRVRASSDPSSAPRIRQRCPHRLGPSPACP